MTKFFLLTQTLLDIFANKCITFTVIESLPKEKTATLGTAEIFLFKKFLNYYTKETFESAVPECELSFSQTVPLVYQNQKLIDPKTPPEISVEVSLSAPLIAPQLLQQGLFASFKVEDVLPVPEDWSVREGNEKDACSNIYNYNISITIPKDGDGERQIELTNGQLTMSDEILISGILILTLIHYSLLPRQYICQTLERAKKPPRKKPSPS